MNLNCSHITNACNPFDAVARFVRETRAQGCTVYAVEQVEPVRPVCLSTTGYRFMQKGFIWLCLDTGVFRRGVRRWPDAARGRWPHVALLRHVNPHLTGGKPP
uniref:hypothetical protein n=1 Tax=Serratia marcescens TaxID=615 RepID=UPI0020B1BE96|nr:hypothetical protein [Serratia marcescens]